MSGENMKIFRIESYRIPSGIKKLNQSIDYLNSKADKLMERKNLVTGMLPNSMKKCNGTNMTVMQLIDLVLRHK